MTEAARQRRRAEAAGRFAETVAALLLNLKGHRILAKRLRTPVGELDLIARRGGEIAFVEVKRRAGVAAGLEAVTPRARRRLIAAARWWLARNPDYGGYRMRFDVVVWVPWGWPRHLRNAFQSESRSLS